MSQIIKNCKISKEKFTITSDDIIFYKNINVLFGDDEKNGLPTLCPNERMRRRLAWRNERNLFNRDCSVSGKKIVSMYSSDVKFPVYDNDYWWGDEWDAKDFFIKPNLTESFFYQFEKLLNIVPRMARIQQGTCENSRFTNCASYNKNCYLLFTANFNEDCSYGNNIFNSQNSIDNLRMIKSELCYECVDVEECYNSLFLNNSKRCTDSYFLKNCISCSNCFGSANLRNKEYYFLNKKYSKEEYLKKLKSVEIEKYSKTKDLRKFFKKHFLQYPVKSAEVLKNENSSGNYLYNSKNSFECWDALNLEDCKYSGDGEFIKSSYDVNYYGCSETNELLYECEGVGHGVYNMKFSKLCWGGCKNLEYCIECFKSEDCFGCIGLKNAQYCIFNTQYSKEQYFELREKMREHMQKTGEWGEFFPIKLSPFGYNQTVAQEYFPLTKEVALEMKYNWGVDDNSAKYTGINYVIPDDIKDVDVDICTKILECEVTKKLYKITSQELQFYKKMNIPIPRKCPDQRHKERMALRNPRKLFERNCDNCNVEISTTYAPERLEKVYCEKCYVDSVD